MSQSYFICEFSQVYKESLIWQPKAFVLRHLSLSHPACHIYHSNMISSGTKHRLWTSRINVLQTWCIHFIYQDRILKAFNGIWSTFSFNIVFVAVTQEGVLEHNKFPKETVVLFLQIWPRFFCLSYKWGDKATLGSLEFIWTSLMMYFIREVNLGVVWAYRVQHHPVFVTEE